MENNKKLIVRFKQSEYEILKFFSYTSAVTERLYETAYGKDELSLYGNELKDLFERVIEIAEVAGKDGHYLFLRDNKCVFMLKNVKTNTCIYIGQYDGQYSLGLSCKQSFGRVYDFAKGEWSKYNAPNDPPGISNPHLF